MSLWVTCIGPHLLGLGPDALSAAPNALRATLRLGFSGSWLLPLLQLLSDATCCGMHLHCSHSLFSVRHEEVIAAFDMRFRCGLKI